MQDLLIIGAGPAGLTAGLYAARKKLDSLILEGLMAGGQLAWAGLIENYPGFPEGIKGSDLALKIKEQAEKAGVNINGGQVTGIFKEKEGEFVVTAGQEYRSRAVIVASGNQPVKLGVPGEAELIGKGVSYCAICDGPFFRNRVVAVFGSGGAAVREAIFLTRFASKVILIYSTDKPPIGQDLQDRLKAETKVESIGNSAILRILGESKVTGIQVKNLKTGGETALVVDGVFVFAGFRPSTGFLPPEVKTVSQGYIVTDEAMETSVSGLFACGDCRQKILRQVVTACAEGATAVLSAQKYLEKL